MNLKYPVSKSHAAFLMNVDNMYAKWKKVYMWTFTFAKFQPDWRAMERWKEFQMKLVGTVKGPGKYPLLVGLRVVEVHPGRNFHGLSHGLHFHCLFNTRVCVHWVRRVARKFDFGIVDVREVTQEEARYIGKYLTKGQPELSKGARRWGTINWPAAVKVTNIEIDSPFHRNMKQVQEVLKMNQLGTDVVHSIYVNTRLWGDYKNWPIDRFYYSGKSADLLGPHCKVRHEYSDPTLKPLKLLRSNRRIREQSMKRTAAIWKERARRASLGHDGRTAEDWQRMKEKRQTAGGEKFFSPPGDPRGRPGTVLERDGTVSYYVDEWDKKEPKQVGIAPA